MSIDQSPNDAGPPTSAQPYERSRAVTWIGLAVIGLLLLTYLVVRRPPGGNQGANHPAVGQPILLFELEPLTDATTPLSRADLQGKVTLVNLWATWCGPCEEEFPTWLRFASDSKIAVIFGTRRFPIPVNRSHYRSFARRRLSFWSGSKRTTQRTVIRKDKRLAHYCRSACSTHFPPRW
jgi:thiol-disulfide isomerase/thioredoxin